MIALTTPEEADRFIESNPTAAVFKAGTCHKTMQGWGNVERLLEVRPEIPVGIIKVVENRPASNRVAERTNIVHHSPQVILFRNGQPLFELNNWDITAENLEHFFQQYLADIKVEQQASGKVSNLEGYKRLMDGYLGGAVSEPQFMFTYLNMFRADADLRSQEEFALIDSLFGNPDAHHVHPMTIMQADQGNPTPLRERVEALRQKMEAY
jgi:bacillithiol system protein YtxJ